MWKDFYPILKNVQRPSRYLGAEYNCPQISANSSFFNFCMVYPDIYEIGQPNQAMRILCNCLNDVPGVAAQRAYLPDPDTSDLMRESGVPMFSLESYSPLCDFDAVGITVSHELAATNILEVLDLSQIPLLSSVRTDDDPIIFGGGPMYCNPEPYHAFFDVITIGEGEEALSECVKIVKDMKGTGCSRKEILHALSHVEGIYVPLLYEVCNGVTVPKYEDVPTKISRRIMTDFHKSPAYYNCIVPYMDVAHDRLNVEVLRGCARGCRFCQAGIMYRPVRERTADNICAAVETGLKDTGYEEVSLTSLSTTDHSQIKEILARLNRDFADKGIRISIPSQRLDSFGIDMAALVAGNKKGGLTFAVEAGSQRLCDVINKNVTEENLFSAVKSAFESGWNRCKLYFMIGLPTETDEDVVAIADLCEKVLACARESAGPKRGRGVQVAVSCAVFVPKAQTPFMWAGQVSPEEAKRKVSLIRSHLKSRAIRFNWHEPKTSFIEAVISRGGRECSDLIMAAWKHGARFDAWNEYFDLQHWMDAAADVDLDIVDIAQRNYEPGTKMPWSHISMGVSDEFFISEWNQAQAAQTTPDCTFDKCSNCGVCFRTDRNNPENINSEKTRNRLAGKRCQ